MSNTPTDFDSAFSEEMEKYNNDIFEFEGEKILRKDLTENQLEIIEQEELFNSEFDRIRTSQIGKVTDIV